MSGEIISDNMHTIRYLHTLPDGDVLFADCHVNHNALFAKESVQVMKDFEDMIADIEYSDKLLASYINR